ncbi:MAG: hypothetical protein Q8O56_16515 [Solirubrobacteraceae bacterium]|nr:hypothetical protein [Solirubrobacteraceae bacterium]
MSDLEPTPTPVGEEIHLPGPSAQPVLVAVGITITLIGVTMGLLVLLSGLVLTVAVIIRWVADTRREMRALPEDLSSH